MRAGGCLFAGAAGVYTRPVLRAPATRALGLLLAASLGLPAAAQAQAPVQPPPEDTNAATPTAPISAEADMSTSREAPAPTTPTLGKPLRPGQKPEPKRQPALVAPANNVSPSAGMGGRLISADDPEARRAEAELEGTALDKKSRAGVPKRLPPLQRAAWWCMFGTFALASTGGVLAGLAEVQEDAAERVAITLDPGTGGQQQYSGSARAEYEAALAAGRRDATLARGFLAVSGVTLVAGVVLFIVHATRVRKQGGAGRLRAAAGGLAVHF
jgi:hypothetical protein